MDRQRRPIRAIAFYSGLTEAIHAEPTPTALTVGWGDAEDSWTPQARTAITEVLADAAVLGVTVCVAAGDSGSESGYSDAQSPVYFPASSPYALACGGSSLMAERTAPGGDPEVVWPVTGGGVSDVFALLHPLLYEGISPGVTQRGFRPITQGNNGAYRAGPGWNACTGLGSPKGTELVELLRDGTVRSG